MILKDKRILITGGESIYDAPPDGVPHP